MICVLLGASFSFISICLLLFRIILVSIKKSRIAFAMLILLVYMLLFEKQKVYRCCKDSLEKPESGIMLNLFAY